MVGGGEEGGRVSGWNQERRGDGEESPKADSDVTQFLGRAA